MPLSQRPLPAACLAAIAIAGLGGCGAPPAARVCDDAVALADLRLLPMDEPTPAADPPPDRALLESEWPQVSPSAVPPAAVRLVRPQPCRPVQLRIQADCGPERARCEPPGLSTPVLLRVRASDRYGAPSLRLRPAQPPTRGRGHRGWRASCPPTR